MRVLIADDNPDAAEMLAMVVRSWQYDAVLAHDGVTAFNMIHAAETPILCLLDWIMPGLNGIEVCRQLRQDASRPYSYLILMTGRGDKQQMLDGLEAGADDYLIKPVDATELHARLNTGKRILKLQQLLREQATRDSLTSLWNRAEILSILNKEMARSRRHSHPVSVIMADIDHFKSINDTQGHLVGDQVIRQVSQRLRDVLRPYDTVGRYGGEEFLIVLAGCSLEKSLSLAERLRRCVETERIQVDGTPLQTTLSLGVATWDGHCSENALLQRADDALYRAKAEGRNRVQADGDLVLASQSDVSAPV